MPGWLEPVPESAPGDGAGSRAGVSRDGTGISRDGTGIGRDGAAVSRAGDGDSAAGTDAARQRLALAQTALLSALVAGTPAPEGFDRVRLQVQSRALTAKRTAVVAKVAPELPDILGADYRAAFLDYARHRPMSGGYRQDALDFAAHLLAQGRPQDPAARQQLTRWWRDRAGPKPPSARPVARLVRAVWRALGRSGT